ncbi:MAG TPA: HEAT repeat domain-containing protein, partial [bacterium]|nr:HEAT repeat domain-containing protein [bacterium]
AVARAAVADPDPAVRELAADTLLLWNSAASEAALVEMLSDDVWSVRKAAARSLARFVRRHGVHSSASACEALYRMTRMFPSASQEKKLAEEAISSLDPSRENPRRLTDSRAG